MPKHRLAGVKPGSAAAMSRTTGISSDADRIKVELTARLDKVNDELKEAIAAKVKAEANAAAVLKEKKQIAVEFDKAVRTLRVELESEKSRAEATIAAFKSAFPEDVAELGTALVKKLPDGIGSRRVVYLYLAIITSDSIEETAFGNRFKLFDDELYQLLRDVPAVLKQVRDIFATDINGRLTGLRIAWNFLGEPFDTERFSSLDSYGTEVTEVISALITKINGSIVRRAKVRTEDVNVGN